MTRLSGFALGFILVLLCHTLAGGLSFLALGTVVAIVLFDLFHSQDKHFGLWLTLGFCVAEESLGTARFGLASTLGLLLVMLQQSLGLRLNFTSRALRYVLALAIALAAYAVLLFSPAGLLTRLEQLSLLYPFLSLIGYYVSSLGQKPTYELI